MQLWIAWSERILCACVTQIEISKRKRFLTILFIGGEKMELWLEYMNLMIDFAKANECDEIRVFGRKGWGRVLNSFGFDNPLSLFRKKING